MLFQPETSTGRKKAKAHNWKVNRIFRHVIGTYSNLQGYQITNIYKELTKHQLALESEPQMRNSVQYIPLDVCCNFQTMFPDPEHSALPMGSLVTSPLHGKGTTSARQDTTNNSSGVTQPSKSPVFNINI